MDATRIQGWTKNTGRPRTRTPQPDTLIRLLEPCSFGGVGKAPGEEVMVTKSQAAGLLYRRRAQLAADAPPPDLADRRARYLRPSHYTVRHLLASALPCFRYCVRKAGQTEIVNEQLARELVAGGWADIVAPAEAPAAKKRAG